MPPDKRFLIRISISTFILLQACTAVFGQSIRLANGLIIKGEFRQTTDAGLEIQTPTGSRTLSWETLSAATRYRYQLSYRANYDAILHGSPPSDRTNVVTDIVGGPADAKAADLFAYTNGLCLDKRNGGQGWTSAWIESRPNSFTIAAGSFGNRTGYPTNYGNKVMAANPNQIARRNFTAFTTGQVYAAYLMNYGSNEWCGMSFMDGNNEQLFFGILDGQPSKFGLSIAADKVQTVSSHPLSTGPGNDYLIFGAYNFDTGVFKTKAYGKSDNIPSAEPVSWDATTTVPAGKVIRIDGICLNGGRPGPAYFDEVRVTRTWSGLWE